MLTRIKRWLAPPIFEDEDKTRIAGLLTIILPAVFVIVLILTLFTGLLPGSEPTVLGRMAVGVVTALLVLVTWFAMRRGRVRAASVLLSSMLLVNVTLAVYFVGTIRAPITGTYIVCIVIAGLLIGSRAAAVFSLLSLLALLGLLQAEVAGTLPPAQASSGINNWITHAGTFGMTAVLLGLATRGINDALERARRNERALAESNRELEAEIAERMGTEEALRESEERLRSIVEQSTDGIVLTDEQGAVIEWNQGQEQITGLKRVDVLGQSLWDVQFQVSSEERNTPAVYEQVKASMLEFFRTGQAPWLNRPQETVIMRPDGTRQIVQAMIFPIETGKGFMAGSISRDVTERVQAEEALRESEEKFRSLAEQSPNMIFVNEKGRVVYANKKCEEVMGYKRQAFYSPDFDFFTLIAPESRDLVKACFSEHMKGQDVPPYEYVLVTKEGERIEAINAPKLIRYGGESAILGIVTDITDRVRAEEELKRYRDHLEELVKERTRKLEEAQGELVRQERLSALGQLTATIAHEIRNPLGTIRTVVFAIGDAIERHQMERVERALQLAERNVIRCDNIISELLDYTRDRVLQLKPTNIDMWLDVVLDEQAIPEGIVCTRELNVGIEIPIDGECLRRAVINVVNNAVDALRAEGAQENWLTVSTHVVEDRAGPRLEIRISDTGPGIPDDVLGKIFEPLFSTKSYGVGLGLPIAKNIVEQHGGGIKVQSKLGLGTTVVLWLPIQKTKLRSLSVSGILRE